MPQNAGSRQKKYSFVENNKINYMGKYVNVSDEFVMEYIQTKKGRKFSGKQFNFGDKLSVLDIIPPHQMIIKKKKTFEENLVTIGYTKTIVEIKVCRAKASNGEMYDKIFVKEYNSIIRKEHISEFHKNSIAMYYTNKDFSKCTPYIKINN